MTDTDSKAERNAARQLYLWSMLLPILALPLACLGPAIGLLPLLYLYFLIMGFRSQHPFVRWHTGQWLLFSMGWGVFAVCGALPLMVSGMRGSASLLTCLGSLIIGGGWWLSNLFGLWQVSRGSCWIWSMWSNSAPLPRSWKPAEAITPVAHQVHPSASTDWRELLSRGQLLSRSQQRAKAVACFMQVFRAGPPALRQQAIAELEVLGEVEVF